MLTLGARLKVLKEEIRKQYFLKLKQFLWDQGVKGAEDSSKSLKVYPARKIRHESRSFAALTSDHTTL